jgi:hypothetical protein
MPSEAHNLGEEEGSVMLVTRNLVWLGFMLLLVSAMFTPQMAAALEVSPAASQPAASQAAWGQPLPDSTLKDVSGKYASYTLSGYGMVLQVNQATSNNLNQSRTTIITISHHHRR